MSKLPVKHILLNDGKHIPQFGLGLFLLESSSATGIVQEAIKLGYRHFDCASIYENESELGETIKKDELSRKDFFITTKLWNNDQKYKDVFKAVQE